MGGGNIFVDNSRVEPTILSMEKISFSFEIFLRPFLWAILH